MSGTSADKRALVTGADGFVGTKLVDYLRHQGWDVAAIGGPPFSDASPIPQLDLANASDVIDTVNATAPFTHVFHLAALTFVPEAMANPTATIDINVSGTIRLLDATHERAPEARFIFVSTSEVYGPPQRLPVDEDHPLNPNNPYAIAKAAADAYCRYAHDAHGRDIIVVRPFNHSGPGQTDRFALPSFARQIAEMEAGKREPVLRVGDLSAARDFTHVDDVIRAYERIATDGSAGEVYNVCSGESHTLQEAVDILRKHATLDIEVNVDPERLRPVDVPEVCGNAQKLQNATGWQPKHTFDELLVDLLRHWREVV